MDEEGTNSSHPQAYLSITDRELFDRLGWFTQVRWAFGVFSLLMLLFCWKVLGVCFRIGNGMPTVAPAAKVVLAMFLYNAAFTFLVRIVRSRKPQRHIAELLALGQIFCDLVAICSLIHYTGGVVNMFVILILVPIVIVTELLPQRLAYATAGVAALLINALAWAEQQGILLHAQTVRVDNGRTISTLNLHANPLYILHVSVALTVTIFATVFVASTIAARLRKRESQLELAYRQLHALDETKAFFMRKASHEMRAPLAAIHSIIDAIKLQPGTMTSEQTSLLNRVRRRTKAMMSLVRDLTRYSRLRSPEAVFHPAPVCLSDLVSHTIELMQNQAQENNLTLSAEIQKIWVRGDEELLREVVTNLVANAIQYTPSGGQIDVSLNAGKADTAVLTVADTGIGIRPEDAEQIFEEFYRTTAAKRTFAQGTGLGLSIVRKIVHIHHGEITAAPRPDSGSVFTVTLPRSKS